MSNRLLLVYLFSFIVFQATSTAFGQEINSLSISPLFDREENLGIENETLFGPSQSFFPTLGFNLTQGLFTSQNLYPFIIGSVATLAVLPVDKKISNGFMGDLPELGDSGQILGGPQVMLPLVGGAMLAFPFTENEKFRSFSFALTRAFIIDNLMVGGLKRGVGRARPNLENDHSFPSGHSSNSFAVATVVNHYYGKKAGIPAYILASLVALSRVESGKHYASDVIFGATLGIISGRAATQEQANVPALKGMSFAPYATKGTYGLDITIRF